MIENSTSLPIATQNPGTPASQPSAMTKGLASDFETFLKMLTAQARYQDPLEPIDSTEYAAQLAQFSMVEQQVQTNDTLSALISQMGVSNMASLSGWVGMEARADTPINFDGTPITVAPNPARTADEAFLVVKNSAGQEAQRLPIPLSSDPIQWAGVDQGGSPLASDIYEFSVESFSQGERIATTPAEIYAQVSEAQLKENAIMLVLNGGQTIPASSVSAIRHPRTG